MTHGRFCLFGLHRIVDSEGYRISRIPSDRSYPQGRSAGWVCPAHYAAIQRAAKALAKVRA